MKLTLKKSYEMIEAAHKKAEELGIKVVVAVTDASGHLIALGRMDDAAWGSISVAVNKAFTAAAWGLSTGDIAEQAGTSGPMHSIHFSNDLKLITFGGGMPLRDADGQLIGAIGVSAGTVEEDVQCAQAGCDALLI